MEGIAGQPRATQRRAPAKPHYHALPRDATPARYQRQPADGFDTQPRLPRAGTAQEDTVQAAVAVACGHGIHAARPRCPSPCPVRAIVRAQCLCPTLRGHGARAYYLWGTAPPPRAPHPSRRCYAVATRRLSAPPARRHESVAACGRWPRFAPAVWAGHTSQHRHPRCATPH